MATLGSSNDDAHRSAGESLARPDSGAGFAGLSSPTPAAPQSPVSGPAVGSPTGVHGGPLTGTHGRRRLPTDADTHDLAVTLCPVLRRELDDRLSPIDWFHAAWQRGGAATGFATYGRADGRTVGVLAKLPVGPEELGWTAGLGRTDDWDAEASRGLPVPRVVASGSELNGYDLGWFVVERLVGPSMSKRMNEADVRELLSTAADFQAVAAALRPVSGRPPRQPWERAIEHSRAVAKLDVIPEAQRWNDALKRVSKHLDTLIARWEHRPLNAWCHGDLHPGNILRRAPSEDGTPGRCVLIDLALVHPGHWIEDALYLERQYWGHEEYLGGVKPVSKLGKLRRERGLAADEQAVELANIRRVLMAACVPANSEREGNHKYMHAALTLVETLLPQIGH